MSATIRVRRHLESETVHLPEAHALVGRDVEIIVREVAPDEPGMEPASLRGSVLHYDEPFSPVVDDDWNAMR